MRGAREAARLYGPRGVASVASVVSQSFITLAQRQRVGSAVWDDKTRQRLL